MNSTLKKNILQKTKKYLPHMVEAEQSIWSHPQTGFHEWDAHNYLVEKFLKLGFEVTEVGDIPGFYFDIDSGKEGPAIAILGELDAIILAEHPDCDPKTSAVHACGHHFQSSALLGIAGVLSEDEVLSVIEKAILFYKENGITGERFNDTITRIGFEKVNAALIGE